VNQMTNSHW